MGGLIVGMLGGLKGGIAGGLMIGLIGFGNIEPYEVFNLNLSSVNIYTLFRGIRFGLLGGLLVGLMIGIMAGLTGNILAGLVKGVVFGVIIGLIVGLMVGLKGRLRIRKTPNQGIWDSGKNTIIITILSYPLFLAVYILPNIVVGIPINRNTFLLSSIVMSLILGIYLGGGIPFIKHFTLRYFLWCSGNIPFNYVDFLQYAEERGMMLRTGGSFRFYHDILREYLAEDN